MRIVFNGAVQFSEKALVMLIHMKADVVGICTLETSAFNVDQVDLTPVGRKNNIPVTYTPDVNSEENISCIKSFVPDVIFVLVGRVFSRLNCLI